MQARKALGRGLDSLISPTEPTLGSEIKETLPGRTVPIDRIFANRQQPRYLFKEEALQELALSIKRDGLIQPIVVSATMDGRYELIAGERRWRASKMAGLQEVPVIIKNVSEEKRLELALVENIQRENLNPIEEAKGYQTLVDQFQLSHADIAERVGKSREYVANAVRLLKLPKVIQEDVRQRKMKSGHARSLLALPSVEEQLFFREKILKEVLTVRDVERMVQERKGLARKIHQSRKKNLSPQTKLLLDEIQRALATKVRLQQSAIDGNGTLLIDFYSWQDLDRIYKKLVTSLEV